MAAKTSWHKHRLEQDYVTVTIIIIIIIIFIHLSANNSTNILHITIWKLFYDNETKIKETRKPSLERSFWQLLTHRGNGLVSNFLSGCCLFAVSNSGLLLATVDCPCRWRAVAFLCTFELAIIYLQLTDAYNRQGINSKV